MYLLKGHITLIKYSIWFWMKSFSLCFRSYLSGTLMEEWTVVGRQWQAGRGGWNMPHFVFTAFLHFSLCFLFALCVNDRRWLGGKIPHCPHHGARVRRYSEFGNASIQEIVFQCVGYSRLYIFFFGFFDGRSENQRVVWTSAHLIWLDRLHAETKAKHRKPAGPYYYFLYLNMTYMGISEG